MSRHLIVICGLLLITSCAETDPAAVGICAGAEGLWFRCADDTCDHISSSHGQYLARGGEVFEAWVSGGGRWLTSCRDVCVPVTDSLPIEGSQHPSSGWIRRDGQIFVGGRELVRQEDEQAVYQGSRWVRIDCKRPDFLPEPSPAESTPYPYWAPPEGSGERAYPYWLGGGTLVGDWFACEDLRCSQLRSDGMGFGLDQTFYELYTDRYGFHPLESVTIYRNPKGTWSSRGGAVRIGDLDYFYTIEGPILTLDPRQRQGSIVRLHRYLGDEL